MIGFAAQRFWPHAAYRMLQAATRHDAMPQILFLNSTVTSATYRA